MTLKINIFTPGTHDKAYLPLISEYQKRTSRFAEVNWNLVKTGDKTSENLNLLKAISGARYIVLDENGSNIRTEDIAVAFSSKMQSGDPVINLVIGGAYGLDDELIKNAEAIWALGKITLPHQLVRLIITEQIYRALTIIANHPYHHK